MKNKILILVTIGLVIIGIGYYFWFAKIVPPGVSPDTNNVPPETNNENVVQPPSEPLVLDEQTIAGVREGLTQPFMKEIRRSLDAVRANDKEWIDSHPWFSDEKLDKYNALKDLTEKELASRFTPFAVSQGLMGGLEVGVIFINEPKYVYTAWVYEIDEEKEGWELRGFWRNNKAGPEWVKWFMDGFAPLKDDLRNSI